MASRETFNSSASSSTPPLPILVLPLVDKTATNLDSFSVTSGPIILTISLMICTSLVVNVMFALCAAICLTICISLWLNLVPTFSSTIFTAVSISSMSNVASNFSAMSAIMSMLCGVNSFDVSLAMTAMSLTTSGSTLGPT